MKGYYTDSVYMGWTGSQYMPFETETAYREWYQERG